MTIIKLGFVIVLLLWDRLPTKENLIKRNIVEQVVPECSCCKTELETTNHFFLQCPEISKLWSNIVAWTRTSWVPPRDVDKHHLCFSTLLKESLERGWVGFERAWYEFYGSGKTRSCLKECDFLKIEAGIKFCFWSWCVVRCNADPCISFFKMGVKSFIYYLECNLTCTGFTTFCVNKDFIFF